MIFNSLCCFSRGKKSTIHAFLYNITHNFTINTKKTLLILHYCKINSYLCVFTQYKI